MSRLRFSLKGLLAALTVGCLLLGWQVEKRCRMLRAVQQVTSYNQQAFFYWRVHSFPDDPSELLARYWDPDALPWAISTPVNCEETVIAISQVTTIQSATIGIPESGEEWLRRLESLSNLRELWVVCPKMTDRALYHLSKLKRLETFDTTFTGFTQQAIEQFRRALPNCQILVHGDETISASYPPLNGRKVGPRATYP